jgi:hypothetical protein
MHGKTTIKTAVALLSRTHLTDADVAVRVSYYTRDG